MAASSSWEETPRIIFPLSLLSIAPDSEKETLNQIIQYGVGAWIKRQYETITADGVKEAHTALKFNGGTADSFKRALTEGDARARRIGADPDARVALPLEWCFRIRDGGGGFTFREFRVLCAIYSIVGSSSYKMITQPRIEKRTTGAKSESLRSQSPEGTFLVPLTAKQTRNTLAELAARNCFARYSPVLRGIRTFYSVTMTTDSLAQRINAQIIARAEAEQRQPSHQEILKARLEEITGKRRSVGNKEPTKRRRKGDINETLLNETKRNEIKEIEHGKPKVSRSLPSLDDLKKMGYDEEQADAIDYYHSHLVRLGYLPVNQYSEEVVNVLETHDSDGIKVLVDAVLEEGRSPAKGDATLVRLGWDNY